MKLLEILILLCCVSGCIQAQTVGYWRFEAGTAGQAMSVESKIADLSGNHNDLRTFSEATAPTFSSVVPFEKIPQTGEANQLSIENSAAPGARMPTRDLFIVHQGEGFDLNRDELPQWTIEASIQCKPIENWQKRWQAFIVRDGYNIPNRRAQDEDRLANLGFKKRGDNNHLSIEAWDSSGKYVVVQSNDEVKENQWYHVAAASDGTKLSLYVKGPGDATYIKQNEADFSGALANGGEGWAIGRGCYANWPTEQFFGLIDEVRISVAALPPEEFLATASPNPVAPSPATVPTQQRTVSAAEPAYPAPSPDLIHPHDPATIKAGDKYHVFATHQGILHWRSSDLLHWEKLPDVFSQRPEWTDKLIGPNPGLWAPDVAFFNGQYHLYYSVSHFGSQRSAIGLVTNRSLDPEDSAYRWEDQGIVIESNRGDPSNAIDPSLLIDVDGTPWMCWGSWNQGIFLVKLDPKTGKLADPTFHHLAARPRNDALEGPQVFYHDGWYYLTISNDFCCRGAKSTYKLMVGRSKQITGPYLDRESQPMLEGHSSLLVRSYDYHRGPGHSSVVTKGDELFLTHHYYDSRANGIPTLAVRPLYFDDDGWPLVGEPIDTLTSKAPDLNGAWRVFEDYAATGKMNFSSNSVSGSLGQGHFVIEGSRLTLTWPARGRDQKQTIDRCFLSEDQRSFVGRRADGTIVVGLRE